MDNNERAALLIRVAQQIRDSVDKQAILSWAEELISKTYAPAQNTKQQEITYPIDVFARYKNILYHGKLLNDGKIERNGDSFSPSKAAINITHNSVNGWRFWRYMNKNGQERAIDTLRTFRLNRK
ncbi:MAG: hypothetical protein C4555_06120 [Dehalococcoidia bacterium]|jgi:hypothetical protein|nr:MAG: hypothetical protein C4555_06120 [Dehalococcoidia bacterium]